MKTIWPFTAGSFTGYVAFYAGSHGNFGPYFFAIAAGIFLACFMVFIMATQAEPYGDEEEDDGENVEREDIAW